MRIDYIPVLKLKKYQYFITNKTDKSLFFYVLLQWFCIGIAVTKILSDCCLSDQKEEHVSCWPDDNDVFFELDRYTRRKILVLFHRNNSPQNPCLKSDTLYWLQVNQSLFFFFTWSSVLSRHFFVCLYLYCRCRSNYQEGGGLWSHSLVYCRYIFVPVPSQELDFHRHMLWSIFSIIWKEM